MNFRAAEKKAGGREEGNGRSRLCSWPRERKHLTPKTLQGRAKRAGQLQVGEKTVTQQKSRFSEICLMAALTMMQEQGRTEFAKGR